MRRTDQRSIRALTAVLVLATATALPQAQGQLYRPAAPPGSAFVRVFNSTAGSGVQAQVDDKSLPPLPPYAASSYLFFPAGAHAVQAGSHHETLKFEADHYYTVAETADGLKVFDVQPLGTQLKSAVMLFNLMPGTPLDLKASLPDGPKPVFQAVAPYTSAQREINPLKLNLRLDSGDRKIADAAPVQLERGHAAGLFAAGTVDAPVLVWAQD